MSLVAQEEETQERRTLDFGTSTERWILELEKCKMEMETCNFVD